MESEAFKLGYNAVTLGENPYKEGTQEYEDFRVGYGCAWSDACAYS
jgi:hypothetical protein